MPGRNATNPYFLTLSTPSCHPGAKRICQPTRPDCTEKNFLSDARGSPSRKNLETPYPGSGMTFIKAMAKGVTDFGAKYAQARIHKMAAESPNAPASRTRPARSGHIVYRTFCSPDSSFSRLKANSSDIAAPIADSAKRNARSPTISVRGRRKAQTPIIKKGMPEAMVKNGFPV